jgi:hypothetical protein
MHHRNLCANIAEPDWLMPFGDVALFIVSIGEDVELWLIGRVAHCLVFLHVVGCKSNATRYIV